MEKMILTDADGVLLNWIGAFEQWMHNHRFRKVVYDEYDIDLAYGLEEWQSDKLIKQFNESANIGHLAPYLDSVKYVKKLHEEHGYVFRVITSLGLDPYAAKLREKNLKKLFGTAIDIVICLDTNASKDEALAPYADSGMFWVEDKVENAIAGAKIGLQAILMQQGHNRHIRTEACITVVNWKEIYELITGEVA
jgi:FMN phosphatase YigB (HAD superfamily)